MFSNPSELGQQTLQANMTGQPAAYDPGYTLPNVFSTPSTLSAQNSNQPWNAAQLQNMNTPFAGLGNAIAQRGIPQVNSALANINQYTNNSAAQALSQQSQIMANQSGNQLNSAMSQPLPSQRWNQQYNGQIQNAAKVNQPMNGNITQELPPPPPPTPMGKTDISGTGKISPDHPTTMPGSKQTNISPTGSVGPSPGGSSSPAQGSGKMQGAPQQQMGGGGSPPSQSSYQIAPGALQHMGNTYDLINNPATKQAYASEAYNAFNLIYNHGQAAGVIPQPYASPPGDTKPQMPASMAVMNYAQSPAVSTQQQKVQSMVDQYAANPGKRISDEQSAAGGMDPSHSIPEQQSDLMNGVKYNSQSYNNAVNSATNPNPGVNANSGDQSMGMSGGDGGGMSQ